MSSEGEKTRVSIISFRASGSCRWLTILSTVKDASLCVHSLARCGHNLNARTRYLPGIPDVSRSQISKRAPLVFVANIRACCTMVAATYFYDTRQLCTILDLDTQCIFYLLSLRYMRTFKGSTDCSSSKAAFCNLPTIIHNCIENELIAFRTETQAALDNVVSKLIEEQRRYIQLNAGAQKINL